MHTICSPYGQVLRIVIFKKNGVQTMVEYPFYGTEVYSLQSIIFATYIAVSSFFVEFCPHGPPPRGRGGHQAPSGLVTKLTRSFPSSIIYPSLLLAPSPVFSSPLNPPYIPAAFPLSCPSASHWPYYFPLFHLNLSPHPNGVGVS
jgi:hypothetical protein